MENQKNDNLNLLEAVVQNTEMGKNTLEQILPMTSDVQFKAELLRQRNAQRGLAGSCGADHGQHRVLFVTRSVQTVFPAPSGSI